MEKEILLINPPVRPWSRPNAVPTGLLYLSGVLKREGHRVSMVDLNADRNRYFPEYDRERSLRFLESWVAKSSYNGSGWRLFGIGGIITQYKFMRDAIRTLRILKGDVPIVAGGSGPSSIPHIFSGSDTLADSVVVGEGEGAILEITDSLGSSSALRVVYVSEPLQDIDTLPMPDYGALEPWWLETYIKNPIGAVNPKKWENGRKVDTSRSMNIITTRGCPYRCRFCRSDFFGTKPRWRSADNILKEIRWLNENHDVTYFHICDDLFTINTARVMDFCRLLDESDLDIEWGCAARVDTVNEELIKRMADSGCKVIGYGIESGSPEMLKRMRKGFKLDQVRDALKWTEKHIGWNDCSFIIGFPGETKKTIQETIDFCKDVNLEPEVVFFATAYPGTWLYSHAFKRGLITDELSYIESLGEMGENLLINFTDLEDIELVNEQTGMIEETGAQNVRRHGTS